MTIKVPNYIEPVFPSHALKKVVSEDNVSSLTRQELHVVRSEINQSLFSIERELDVAETRAALPEDHFNYKPINQNWKARICRMRTSLVVLNNAIREQLGNRELEPFEIEAKDVVARKRRRLRRQQFQIDAFIELVADQLGDKVVDTLIKQSAAIADERTGNEGLEAPDFFFNSNS